LGEEVTKTINYDDFWEGVENALNIMKPMHYFIKFANGEGTKIRGIYERMDNMMGKSRILCQHIITREWSILFSIGGKK